MMGDGSGYKAEKCDHMCMKPYSHFLPLQKENATWESQPVLCAAEDIPGWNELSDENQ